VSPWGRMGEQAPVLVVGGGPVGLVAALLLVARGVPVRVLERAAAGDRDRRSRALGIHPPSLRLLAGLDPGGSVAEALVAEGTAIRKGYALGKAGVRLGSLDFGLLPPPFDFVLTLPQWRTEALLAAALEARAPGSLVRGAEVVAVEDAGATPGDGGTGAVLSVRRGGGEERWTAPVVLAADGRRSRVRDALGIPFPVHRYPGRWAMGDFPTEGSGFEPFEAGIHLHPEGLVESFPAGPGLRRWVVEVPRELRVSDDASEVRVSGVVAELVGRRAGVGLDPSACLNPSRFHAERGLAGSLRRGRVVLLGDAAHVVSPIGGQGMNVGWLNAERAVGAVLQLLGGAAEPDDAFGGYAREARRRASRAAARAEQNMRVGGRPGRSFLHPVRLALVRGVLASPARRVLARRFTMHGL
jgi:2-polyprenyl-6-methoxyphenol hydroxylase-like FAD-dependent oxidoreductase